MFVNPETGFLECLHPAASRAFQMLRNGDDVVTALSNILYSTKKVSADTIGRLLEYYIIHQLVAEENQSQTITLDTALHQRQITSFA